MFADNQDVGSGLEGRPPCAQDLVKELVPIDYDPGSLVKATTRLLT
jgi:hypothetical protein